MDRFSRALLALTVTWVVPAVVAAYTGPAHVRRERRELRDSLRDEQRVEALLREFQRARAAGDRPGGLRVEARVSAAIGAELRDTSQQVREQATEVHRDVAKVREDKREGMNTWDHKDPPTTSADRRSLADDRRDMMKEVEFRERLRVIDVEWKKLRGVRRRAAMDRKQELLQELLRLSKFQIQADAQEVREGQQERHDGR